MLTVDKMKIYFPVVTTDTMIFLCHHTYSQIITFIFYTQRWTTLYICSACICLLPDLQKLMRALGFLNFFLEFFCFFHTSKNGYIFLHTAVALRKTWLLHKQIKNRALQLIKIVLGNVIKARFLLQICSLTIQLQCLKLKIDNY